jgi:translation initiation factor 2B subunit (eIF-2B alpha/beta/delta family)
LDIEKQIIFITIDLPELKHSDDSELIDNSERLKFFIYENIYEDLEAVADTIKEYNYKFYSSIKIEENYCPGFQDGIREEVINILNDLNIISAPNSSNVIDKSLKSIDSLSKIKFDNYEIFYKNFSQLVDSLKNIYITRPCHVGLGFIIDRLEGNLEKFPKDTRAVPNTEIKELMVPIINEMYLILDQRKKSKEQINSKYAGKLDGKKNIFLFGFSKMVVDLLRSNKAENFKNNINMYIFECASKRRFSITNNLEYNDGLHYALELWKVGFKNISILPEASFASLLNDTEAKIDDTNSLLLLGANGIDLEGNCGHTSGHLMMVIVAQYYHIPVFLVADKFKIGKIAWNPTLKREGPNWLTGKKDLLKDLKNKNINIVNYREDKIPLKMIDELIMDDELDKTSFPKTFAPGVKSIK